MMRRRALDYHTDAHRQQRDRVFNVGAFNLYGYNNETSEFGFRRMTINASGVTVTNTTQNLISGSSDIRYSNGYIYSTSGKVIDPEQESPWAALRDWFRTSRPAGSFQQPDLPFWQGPGRQRF